MPLYTLDVEHKEYSAESKEEAYLLKEYIAANPNKLNCSSNYSIYVYKKGDLMMTQYYVYGDNNIAQFNRFKREVV